MYLFNIFPPQAISYNAIANGSRRHAKNAPAPWCGRIYVTHQENEATGETNEVALSGIRVVLYTEFPSDEDCIGRLQ